MFYIFNENKAVRPPKSHKMHEWGPAVLEAARLSRKQPRDRFVIKNIGTHEAVGAFVGGKPIESCTDPDNPTG